MTLTLPLERQLVALADDLELKASTLDRRAQSNIDTSTAAYRADLYGRREAYLETARTIRVMLQAGDTPNVGLTCATCGEPIADDDGIWRHEDSGETFCDGDAYSTDLVRQASPRVRVTQTSCQRCELDVEGFSDEPPVWRDRGGDTRCRNDGGPHVASHA